MLNVPRDRSRDDAGFTLPELLITMAILGIIMVPLSQVVISYMLNGEIIRARQTESKDQQIASHYWSADVASVGKRNATTFAAQNGINVDSCGSGGTPQISLSWTKFSFTAPATTTTTSTTTVTYYTTASTATTGGTLIRRSCAGGAPVSQTIARSLLIDGAHPVQCSVGSGSFAACSSMSGTGDGGIRLRFYVADPSGRGQGYWTTLRGQRRQT